MKDSPTSASVNAVDEACKELGPLGPPMVKLLRALLRESSQHSSEDPLLTIKQMNEQYNLSREAAKAANDRGELRLVRGGHNQILCRRSVLEAWLESRPVGTRLRKGQLPEETDELEAMIASGELVRGRR